VFNWFAALPEDQFLAWGWRVPFLAGILLLGVGLFIRLHVLESPLFARLQAAQTVGRMPLAEVLRHHPGNVLLVIGARFAENASFYIFSIFVLSYGKEQLGLPRGLLLNGVMLASVAQLFAIPLFGLLSDRLGRRPVYMSGAMFLGLFAFPFFWLVDSRVPALIWLALVIGLAVGHAAMYGPQAAFFSELFGTRVRYSGTSLGYQLASPLAGGLAPLIATALIDWSGGRSWPVAVYLVAIALITLVSVYLAAETVRADLADQPESYDGRAIKH
jgi:MFS family permease